jgi:cyclic beta-1,2-glucan synthetase
MALTPQENLTDVEPTAEKPLFTQEQLAEHARSLAVEHEAVIRPGPNALLHRLDQNEHRLRAYNRDSYTVGRARQITPASEWILDNFYLIEEQIQMARRHLPRKYSRELPRLTGGRSAGLPLVYDVVLGFISHADAQVDMESFETFIAAYQVVTPLKLGELWAVPIMIRLALIENLRRIADRLALARRDRDLADEWAQRIEAVAEKQPSRLVVVVADMAKADLPSSSSFVAEFHQRLSRSTAATALARRWLEQHLAEKHLSVEQLVRAENQNQAADQVSVSHTITGLRMLAVRDWRAFVETQSIVERVLRTDPADVYRQMDFATRDSYRHSVETLARHGGRPEAEVAEMAVGLAEGGSRANGRGDRSAHVGFYLVGRGLPLIERQASPGRPYPGWLQRFFLRFPGIFYLGSIILATIAAAWAALHGARGLGISRYEALALAPLLILCLSQLVVSIVNWFVTLATGPRLLPRLDYSGGIPPESRTMVVVPTLVSDTDAIDSLVESLEVRYLANRDDRVSFALLSDFTDAESQTLPGDDALRARLRASVVELNERYGSPGQSLFYLFHRPRRWNPGEGCWMGYERKRGKLADFNALLRGEASGAFCDVVGDTAILPSVKFVITLDTDTQLPRNAARLLVATMAHILNRPRFDREKGIVVEGYGILQPRVGVGLPGARRTIYSLLSSGDVGIDPYTKGISDVYQDVFQEGTFIGKGIYDVDAFEEAVGGRFPENAVLSHDLIESAHARSALVTDVELYEDHPASYAADMKRRHRWIRGDWQIALWLTGHVRGPTGERRPNAISLLSQWKILDNLRRSLVPLGLLALLITSWVAFPGEAVWATLLVLAVVLAPALVTAAYELSRKPEELPMGMHARMVGTALGRQLAQVLLSVAFLPFDAYISVDAIARTLVRMAFTRRHLLEWVSSAEAAKGSDRGLGGFYSSMWFAPAVSVGAAVALSLRQPWFLPLAAPFLALWLVAPLIAWKVSQPIAQHGEQVPQDQLFFIRATARKTWHFFETFVNAEEHWLPPDNYQEQPVARVATRTSPTNMGLSLLANLAARDFGYLSAGELLSRTSDALGTMEKLERYRSHFYNWYDTRSLQPLQPLYISTVDSGNLSGHLLTLSQGLRELRDMEVLPEQVFSGMSDTCGVLLNCLEGRNKALETLCLLMAGDVPPSILARFLLLKVSAELASQIGEVQPEEAAVWARRLRESSRRELDDVLLLAPWLEGADVLPGGAPPGWAASGPTLGQLADASRAVGGGNAAHLRLVAAESLSARAYAMAEVDFTFLFDPARKLFATGLSVATRRRDNSFYDLLASEARLASYVAIAFGQVNQDHWFALSRLLVAGHGEPTLASWSGSMFEYLMPMLVMPTYENTLLSETCRGAVDRQIEYGRSQKVPWGVSESGYNLTDAQLNYQYKAFGVPGLGLKRGLAGDLVVAPYATMMALMVRPMEACENLSWLLVENRSGAYGFYEAVDYTPTRVPAGQDSATVYSYMVHHQGMALLAMASFLLGLPMQRRFLGCPALRSSELLLQERIPHATAKVLSKELEVQEARKQMELDAQSASRVFTEPSAQPPEVHLLSNGSYRTMVTQAGGGSSSWRNFALTRWREDATRDCWGTFVYLRDTSTQEFWSAAPQPVMQPVKRQEAIFSQGRAEFRHNHLGLDVYTEVSVSPEDDVELRRVTLTNPGHVPREIELTSYLEVVLAPSESEAAHPAFSGLFVETEFDPAQSAVLCTRRARDADERPPWMFCSMPGPVGDRGVATCETDRSVFIGRGGTAAAPAVLQREGPLANTVGPVLDPVLALRRTVMVPPGGEVCVSLVMGVAETRAGAEALIEKFKGPPAANRTFELAWTHSQVSLRQLNVTEAQAQLFARVGSALLYAQPGRRASQADLLAGRGGQNVLWRHGISGDLPIAVVILSDAAQLPFVQEALQAHAYWRTRGLEADLVVLNDDNSTYMQPLQEGMLAMVNAGIGAPLLGKPGGIFLLRSDQIPPGDRVLLQAVARIVLDADAGSLDDQVRRAAPKPPLPPALRVSRGPLRDTPAPRARRELVLFNGLGGFTPDGREYIITLEAGRTSPAPWINVIANANFGTVVSEGGSSYSWAENCHEFRLTPWQNDPVSDPSGESFYIRDEETGQFWSPTPYPARGASPYTIRHGFGYSVFEHAEIGLASELTIYVAVDAPVKFAVCKVRNLSSRPRRVSVTGYWEWVLGELRPKTQLHVQTEVDAETGALLAQNRYQSDFADRVAFVDVGYPGRTLTGDRQEFLGRNGSPSRPAAMLRTSLSGRVGAGMDPAGALQVGLDIPAGQEREVVFRLGSAPSADEARGLVRRFREPGAAHAALQHVWEYWGRTLGTVNVDTPDPSVNVLVNGWLPYQVLASRLWARTGFYQSGGAFGFRDQLQDVMTLVHAEPALTRKQILLAASRQFPEGDVQHWWHPPGGRGVRTRVSDDYLWLPYVACRYSSCLGDMGVWDEVIPFLAGRQLREHEESYYDQPGRSDLATSLYDHCVRAISNGLKFGPHGLPLMGSGDWNDGMNLVGIGGQGESVWLAFFLCDVLRQFAPVARRRSDEAMALRCEENARRLSAAIEREAWDGAWYKRAFFDDGTPLGSSANPECQIDSLPQSWSVLSGCGDPSRAQQAMRSVSEKLVRRDAGLIQLFEPPFDKSSLNPGYIKGYIPGVRENGGQYTHAAVWAVMAFALRGEHDLAWELFQLLNPARHGGDPSRMATYKVEPYVVAADVYALPPHTGRGGWTWYTGSAGWMYRTLVETLLGVNLEGESLRLTPRLPSAWNTAKVHYRFRQTVYHITFNRWRPGDPPSPSATLDGRPLDGASIPLRDDHGEHHVGLTFA